MSSELQEFKLHEICEFVNGFAFKPESYIDKSADTYEVFRMGYISRGGGFKEDSSPVFVSRSNPKLDKYRLRQGDIIIAMTDMKDKVAILGNTARVPEDNRFVLNQRAGLIRVSRPDLVCPVFLYYYSNWKTHVDYLRARANSGVQVNLSTGAIKEAKVFLPSVSEQRLIGEILSSFDDRITLLRETNATLEAIAQALFKSWFVDFDPVRAKMEGRAPEGMDEATAALFPDSFEESELGLVPRGWRITSLGEICDLQKGCSYKGDGLSAESGAFMFNLGCFNSPRVFATEKIKRYVGEYRDRHSVEAGDLVIANTDMTQDRAILGRPLIVPEGFLPGFISHHVFKVLPLGAHQSESRTFLFYSFLQQAFRERAVGYATGTTVLGLPRDALLKHRLVLPSYESLHQFKLIIDPIFASLSNNLNEIKTLENARDTLLPRLISGQLRLTN